ncbi:hypothetical protein SEVIR_2G069750v4 [Setaria viridis]|uniref:Uncharacterized protein n=1 Tax=Setaria viridis TaxID=4556 RepID=A0A4U6VQU9_SETVI|nr:uncharacterized protein LOC117844725 [Setaria viridis]TKW30913.1 hypothetical protein SEVIR_2G069750v2 [Setaria viridis]
METEVGGDELAQFTIPGRGKKRPPSPAAPPSDEGEDSPMSTTRDDDGWNISHSDSGCEEEKDNEGTDGPFTANNFPKFSSDHFEQTTTLYTYPRIYELFRQAVSWLRSWVRCFWLQLLFCSWLLRFWLRKPHLNSNF